MKISLTYIQILSILMGFLVTSVNAATQTINHSVSPHIKIIQPKQHSVSVSSPINIEGILYNLDTLTINNESVSVNSLGEFRYIYRLPDANKYNDIELIGQKKGTDKERVKNIKVYYKQTKIDGSTSTKTIKPTDLTKPTVSRKKTAPASSSVSTTSAIKTTALPKSKHTSSTKIPTEDTTPSTQKIVRLNTKPPKSVPPKIISKPLKIAKPAKAPISVIDPIKKLKMPIIRLATPDNFHVSNQGHVSFSGNVANTEELYINESSIAIENGTFKHTSSLEMGANMFNIYAIGKNNLNKTLIRKVFRVNPSSPEEVKQETFVEKLNRDISLDLADADIKEVIKILSIKGGLNIIYDKSLTGVLSITLNDTPIRRAIDFILKTQGLSYIIVDNTIMIGEESNLTTPTRLETRVIKLKHVNVKDALDILKSQLASSESVEPFEQDNLLVLKVDPNNFIKYSKIIQSIDSRAIPQILLEAQIVETSVTAVEKMGFSWATSIPLNYSVQISDSTVTAKSETSIFTILNLLSDQGQARILASPRIKAIDKQEASIFIGDKVPYIEITSDTSGRITEAVKYVDAGISLTIFPEINRETQEIIIKVEPEVSYINGFRGKFNDIPIVRTRKVSTTVRVKNGETVIIGGLFNSSDSDSLAKVPLLGDIPLLGQFFSSGKDNDDQTELLITITPRIVDEIDQLEPSQNIFLSPL
jgi:type IV pilus assembly protein PilQ